MATTASSSRTPAVTSSATSGRHTGTVLIARFATGVVLGAFGFWELTAPAQWTGYVPPIAAAAVPPVSLILAHGWVLFVLATAALIDFAAPVVSWIAVAVLAEVVIGLIATSGLTDTLIRDVGLLALALVWALEVRAERQSSTALSGARAEIQYRGGPAAR